MCLGQTGNSGMGCYHGKFTFDQLSHLRSCLIKKLKMEGINSMRYPPHTAKKLSRARFLLSKNIDLGWMGRMMLLAVLGVVAAFVLQVSSSDVILALKAKKIHHQVVKV